MYVYEIINTGSERFYIGITNNIQRRKSSHRQTAKSGKKSPLYDWIRKYAGFEMNVLYECDTREEAGQVEKNIISLCREEGLPILNITSGADGGFVIEDLEDWKFKLKASRKDRKPALGMSHTEENKKLFSEVSQAYWDTQETYGDSLEDILKFSHKEAKIVYGISTTHYYRLKKRFKSNDLE